MSDYKKRYDKYWKDAVEDENGILDKDKIMRELGDYWFLLNEVPKVYCHITGNRISKPNTFASEVIIEYDNHCEELIRDGYFEIPEQ